ncbi:MAG: hypothetical protein P8Y94_10985 [Acidobacteriota bacterium]
MSKPSKAIPDFSGFFEFVPASRARSGTEHNINITGTIHARFIKRSSYWNK